MNKQTSNTFTRFKCLLFMPLAIVLMAMNITVAMANVQKKVVKKTTTTKKSLPTRKDEELKVKVIGEEENEGPNEKVYEVVEQMPQFVGGQAALMRYLSENVKYPVEAQKNGVQGRVVICIIVEKDGTLTHVRVGRSVTKLLDEEAIRVVKGMPKWEAGRQNGIPQRVKYYVPVSFRLQ